MFHDTGLCRLRHTFRAANIFCDPAHDGGKYASYDGLLICIDIQNSARIVLSCGISQLILCWRFSCDVFACDDQFDNYCHRRKSSLLTLTVGCRSAESAPVTDSDSACFCQFNNECQSAVNDSN